MPTFSLERLARRLPDEVWAAFEPVLPPVVWGGVGRPPAGNRDCLHAVVYVAISGIGWKLLPPCFPSYKTVQGRLDAWLALDAFRRVWADCAARYDALRGVNFDQLGIDGPRKAAKKGATRSAPAPSTAARAAPRWC